MKKYILLLLSSSCLLAHVAKAQTGNIHVTIERVESANGNVLIALFNSQQGFVETQPFQGGIVKANKPSVQYTFEDIPVGTYAISAFHDENANNKLDLSFIGIPKEDYGFSQNKFGRFGLPKFEDVRFTVAEGKTTPLVIKLK